MQQEKRFVFNKRNYLVLIAGLLVIAWGYLLMVGDPSPYNGKFNPDIYSFRRITLAPIVSILGYLCIVFSIFVKPGKAK